MSKNQRTAISGAVAWALLVCWIAAVVMLSSSDAISQGHPGSAAGSVLPTPANVARTVQPG